MNLFSFQQKCIGISRVGVLLIAGVASPAMATLIDVSGNTYGGDISGSNPITVQTPNPACDSAGFSNGALFAGAPQTNPYQVFAATNTTGMGAQFLNLNFNSSCGSTEYGINWQMNNLSGKTWYSMHFTLQFAPLANFFADFDADNFDSTPNITGAGFLPLTGWTGSNIDFAGLPGVLHNSSAQFHIPLDMRGNCCNGNILVIATPDFELPEPSTILLVAGALAALVRGTARRRSA